VFPNVAREKISPTSITGKIFSLATFGNTFGNKMKGWKARIKGARNDFQKWVGQEWKFCRESLKENNNIIAVDIDVQRCEQIRHATIQFRTLFAIVSRRNESCHRWMLIESTFQLLGLFLFVAFFSTAFLNLHRFLLSFRNSCCEKIIFNETSNVILSDVFLQSASRLHLV